MKRLAAICAATATLAVPGVASAATFYVDDSATAPATPCTNPTPANACQTITAAITQARGAGFPGADTIMVAAGTYTESATFDNVADSGNILDGAGPGATIIQPDIGEAGVLMARPNITVRDLTVRNSNFTAFGISSPSGAPGAFSGALVENVRVELEDQAYAQPGISVYFVTNAVLNDVEVVGDEMWDGADTHGLDVSSTSSVEVNDSTITSENKSAINVVHASADVNRTTLRGTVDFDEPATRVFTEFSTAVSSLTLDSSLVLSGDAGVEVTDAGATGTASATIRNSTVDPRLPQDADVSGVAANQVGAGDSTSVTIDSSIVRGTLTSIGAGSGTMTCTYSDVTDTFQAAPRSITCDTDPGNPGQNSTSTGTQLFDPGFLDLNWHLNAAGPAIDTGDPSALAAGESATDIEGNPRVLDGNCDGVARQDKGAYEEVPGTCPPSGGTGTSTTAGSQAENPECAVLRAKLQRLNKKIKTATGERKQKLRAKRRKVRNRLRELGCP